MMVPTPFTWRYGGQQVSLSGSFNGWSERIPMVLVEGSDNTFQQILHLPPGCYQYKFLVDGTWKVDPQQICDTDEYGTPNNIVLVSGPEPVTADFTAEASTSGINDTAMGTLGSSSGAPIDEQVLQLSDVQMDYFRQVLSMHLLSSTAYDLIPVSGKVIVLDVNVDVEQAFHVMHELGLAVVPLWNENYGQMAGMLTASDFILILLQLQVNHNVFANQEPERRTVSSWKEWKLQNQQDIDINVVPVQRRPAIHAGPDESLCDVAARILQSNICALPIIHSDNGSSPRLLHVACLAEILGSICRHLKSHLGYLPLLQQQVGTLPVGTWSMDVRRATGRPLWTLRPTDSLTSALTMLLNAQISAVPIVDDGGSIINLYSRSDVTSLANQNIYTHVQLNQMTISQALEVTSETVRGRYQICTRFDSLYRVMELLSTPGVRRVIVIEASSRRVEGIITLRDIFNFFSR